MILGKRKRRIHTHLNKTRLTRMLISIFYNKEHLSQVMDLNHLLKLLAFNSLNFNLLLSLLKLL